jgi:wyosine [tRNA(Phe)-imidazoG37] synthetase (radical SAM superfamily)
MLFKIGYACIELRMRKHRHTETLPNMLYADSEGRVYDHPHYKMTGFSGNALRSLSADDFMPMPEYSKVFFLPGCPPIGLDPITEEYAVVPEVEMDGAPMKCFAVAAFPEAGLVRSHLPAADYRPKTYTLPMWGYTAVGFKDGQYWIAAFRVEYNPKWDPRNYDDRKLIPAIKMYRKKSGDGPLLNHLIGCATNNHCFAAKNLFFRRWEAPLPVSRKCNADCLGCLSLQKDPRCKASHERISFKPSKGEIVSIAVAHLNEAPEPVVSFGQGCEGEPLTEYRLIRESIEEIRKQTDRGTINLNTNGSSPEKIRLIAKSGLDSIRISTNSARREFYEAYYRPKGYDFEDVISSIALSQELGLYTMVNYLVFPGITDQEEELDGLEKLIRRTGLHFLHLKNLCIDPQLYVKMMPATKSRALGMKTMAARLRLKFPGLELGYFNKPVR